MTHAANCNYWTDHDDADCTCGVDWKIRWQTEREMYKAWRKRAEEAEAWKESMLSVMPPMQEIGNELGVLLGDSIHDKILSGIKTLKAQLAIFKPCVELYANARNWGTSKTGCDQWVLTTHGCESAQAALAKVEQMKTELTPLPKGMSKGFYDFMRPGCPTTDSGEAMMTKPTPPDIKRLKEGDLE